MQPQVQQDQASMVLNPSMGSNDSSQQNLVVDGPPLNPFQGIVPVLEGYGPIGPIIQEEADGANVEIGPLQPLNMPEDDILVQELDNEVQAEVQANENQFEAPVVPEDNNNLAIVPYQPPLQPPLFCWRCQSCLWASSST